MGDINPIRMRSVFFGGLSSPLVFIAVIAMSLVHATGQDAQQALPPDAVWKFGNADDGNGIHRLQFSHDGKLLAVRNRANLVSIFDVKTRKLLCEVDGYENNWVLTIDFSPDSKSFVTAAGSSEKVKIWDTQTGKLLSEIDSDAAAAYFDEAGTAINVLGDSHVETYSWPGVQLTDQRKWKSGNETRVGMSRDGSIVVTFRSVNRQVNRTQILDLQTKSKIQLDGPTGIPKTIDISPNRDWMAASYIRDPKIRLWNLRDPHQQKFTLEQHSEMVQSLAFSADSRFLVSTGWDDSVVAWDLLTRQMIKQFAGHTENVMAAAFSPADLSIASGASGASDTSTIVWDLKSSLLSRAAPETPEYKKVWTALGSSTLDSSLMATSQFINGGDPFLDLLEQHIADSSAGSLDETIALLNHPEWTVRERATQELMAVRNKADTELRLALTQTTSPEIKFRISRILKKKIARPQIDSIEVRRWSRIIFALEQINSERSQSILLNISRTTLDLNFIEDAKESFERNEQLRSAQ